MKNILERRNSKILLILFLLTMAVYVGIFIAAFVELPIRIEPVHQLLLLLFHFVPMFFLELLLCQLTRPLWQMLVPVLLLAVSVLVFVSIGEFYVSAWILAGFWCIAPVMGILLARPVWYMCYWLEKRKNI